MAKKGKFIVFAGIDGSGKETQLRLLKKWAKEQGRQVKTADFPQYYTTFFGRLVGRYLAGEFGQLNGIDPHLASLTFAGDRWQAKERIETWLKKGFLVFSNRYTEANMAHQTAKMPERKRNKFLRWLEELEYNIYGIPREDLVLFFYVPPRIAQKLVDKKGKRGYVGGNKRDIAEADLNHLEEASKMYRQLARRYKHWVQINCLDKKGQLKTPEEIHKMVIQVLRRRKVV